MVLTSMCHNQLGDVYEETYIWVEKGKMTYMQGIYGCVQHTGRKAGMNSSLRRLGSRERFEALGSVSLVYVVVLGPWTTTRWIHSGV